MKKQTEHTAQEQSLLQKIATLEAALEIKKNTIHETASALERSVQKTHILFKNSPFSIQVINKDGRTIFVNKSWQELWTVDDHAKLYILQNYNIFDDNYLKSNGLLEHFIQALKGISTRIPPYFYDPKSQGMPGESRWVEGVIYPIESSPGEYDEVVILNIDITEKKEASLKRDKIFVEQTFLANITDSLLSSLSYDDTLDYVAGSAIPFFADGCIVDIIENNLIKRLLTKHRIKECEDILRIIQQNYELTVTSPQPSVRVMLSGKAEFAEKIEYELVRARTIDQTHLELFLKTGIHSFMSIPLQIRGKTFGSLTFLISTNRKGFTEYDLNIGQEITKRASIAFENARLYREANRSIDLRDDFISIASHELRTPLNSLNLQMKVISRAVEGESLDANGLRVLKNMAQNSAIQIKRLDHLVSDMLDISKITNGNMLTQIKNVNISELLSEVINIFSFELINKHIELSFVIPKDVTITCDPFRIEQAVSNLLTNAIKYGSNRPIHLELEKSLGGITISVTDHGSGIAIQDQERIFKRFERAIPTYQGEGIGLGLYIAKEVVSAHKGTITVDSVLGEGSTFRIHLPKIPSTTPN